MPLPKPTPVTVSELNRKAKALLENQLGEVCVEAEIGDLSMPGSGHWYFSLKDARSQLRCAMFRRANARLPFRPKVGDSVIVRGLLSIYEARGDYQLIVDHMEASGDGALQRALEALKQKLQAEGLFDADKKQPIAEHCERIGVVTSPTGAAIEDIISVLRRRSPLSHIALFPVQVQGAGAAQQIVEAIDEANAQVLRGERTLDVLIVGRGGGSLEDLWSFNEESVARAIARSNIPIVSAVGHEIDYSVADLVADLRAATPSQAAELVTRDSAEWLQRIDSTAAQLDVMMRRLVREQRSRTEHLKARLKHPRQQLALLRHTLNAHRDRAGFLMQQHLASAHQPLAQIETRLQSASPRHLIARRKEVTRNLSERLPGHIERIVKRDRQTITHLKQLLTTLGPDATLARGYAIVSDAEGAIIRSSSSVSPSQSLTVTLHDGRLATTVTQVTHEDRD